MKKFNTTGTCLQDKHYMCDVTKKFNRCKYLIEEGYYYAINFPRQYGKTTMKSLLNREFKAQNDYFVIPTSFEGIGDTAFESEKKLAPAILENFGRSVKFKNRELAAFFKEGAKKITNFQNFSEFISDWIFELDKKVILIIDEVDRASNNQTFLSFLAILRDKFLAMKDEEDITFHSVILIGVHDVKALKLKIRPKDQTTLNSPWNISKNLNINFTFSAKEIEPMIDDYATEHKFKVDAKAISKRLYYYTGGSPFLISQMCEIIDENLMEDKKKAWTTDDIEAAYKYITNLNYTTTNFDDMYKNLENNDALRDVVRQIIIYGDLMPFDLGNPVIILGKTYGILSFGKNGKCIISNKIYEFRILNYLISIEKSSDVERYSSSKFFEKGGLNIQLILESFQLFMKEHNSSKDNRFLEKNGRMLLMSFLRSIINGVGFMFKENVTAEDKKMDLVITFNNNRYVIELKIWYGEKSLTDGLKQLSNYLDSYSLDKGYMLIYNFNKSKTYETKIINKFGKKIVAVFV